MTLLFSTLTLNLVFLPKSFRGGGGYPLKRPKGGPVPTGFPPDPRLNDIGLDTQRFD